MSLTRIIQQISLSLSELPNLRDHKALNLRFTPPVSIPSPSIFPPFPTFRYLLTLLDMSQKINILPILRESPGHLQTGLFFQNLHQSLKMHRPLITLKVTS